MQTFPRERPQSIHVM
uniref:Uncharacterized protein n=1 Tax=Lepeophtheirus salmonis TaxID=72036 RepID=A0A0K2VEF5_LEPSM